MEPGLADEEEVDPRIQVGCAGGSRGPWPPRSARLGAPGACAQGSGPRRPGAAGERGSERRLSPGSWGGCGARADAARLHRRDPRWDPGVARSLPCSWGGRATKRKGGGGASPGSGYPIGLPRRGLCATSGRRVPGRWRSARPRGGGPGRPLHLGRPPCLGVGALTWQRGPSGAIPRPRFIVSKPKGLLSSPAAVKWFKTQLFLLVRSSVNRNQGQLVRKADAREGWPASCASMSPGDD